MFLNLLFYTTHDNTALATVQHSIKDHVQIQASLTMEAREVVWKGVP